MSSKYRGKDIIPRGYRSSSTSHYLHHRVTAFFLVPLAIWFVISMVSLLSNINTGLMQYVISPANMVCMILFLGFGIYHGYLGIQVIIYDYIHSMLLKKLILLLLFFITLITIVIGLLAILKIHIMLSTIGVLNMGLQ